VNQLIYGQDRALADWVQKSLPPEIVPGGFGTCQAIGVARGGRPIAAVIYNNFTGQSVEMSIFSTSPHWATKNTLFHFFAYPFITLGCARVTAVNRKRDKTARRMCERLGFTLEGVMKHAYPKDDACIYGMLRRDCRWIGEANGQGHQSAAAA